jgi:hypothetical protein
MIVLDSLNFKSTENAMTQNIKRYAEIYEKRTISGTPFRKVYTQATYTLPSHVSMFYGIFPDNRASEEAYYNRRLFKWVEFDRKTDASRQKGLVFNNASNMITGFESFGYKTIGIGGVGWFDNRYQSTNIWKDTFFQEFHYNTTFHETSLNSIKEQTECISNIVKNNKDNKLFVFVNVSATHSPYQHKTQPYALDKFDFAFESFISPFKTGAPLFIILVSDHGDVITKNWQTYGQRHGFFMPEEAEELMEVPMLVIDMPTY